MFANLLDISSYKTVILISCDNFVRHKFLYHDRKPIWVGEGMAVNTSTEEIAAEVPTQK